MDITKVMSWLEGLAEPDWRECHSDSEVQIIAQEALALLKWQDNEIDTLNTLVAGYEMGAIRPKE